MRATAGNRSRGRDRRHMGEIVAGAVRAHHAGAQIDHALRCVEQPRVRVPLIGGGSEAPVGACQPLDCRDGLGAGQLLREPWLGGFCGRRDTPRARCRTLRACRRPASACRPSASRSTTWRRSADRSREARRSAARAHHRRMLTVARASALAVRMESPWRVAGGASRQVRRSWLAPCGDGVSIGALRAVLGRHMGQPQHHRSALVLRARFAPTLFLRFRRSRSLTLAFSFGCSPSSLPRPRLSCRSRAPPRSRRRRAGHWSAPGPKHCRRMVRAASSALARSVSASASDLISGHSPRYSCSKLARR